MEKIYKSERYLVSASAPKDGEAPSGADVNGFMKRAGLKHGFKFYSAGAYGPIGEICPTADASFAKVKTIMNEVSHATGMAIFLSNAEDVVGNNLLINPKEQQKNAFLRSGP